MRHSLYRLYDRKLTMIVRGRIGNDNTIVELNVWFDGNGDMRASSINDGGEGEGGGGGGADSGGGSGGEEMVRRVFKGAGAARDGRDF